MRHNVEYPIEYWHREADGNDYAPAVMRAQLELSPVGAPTVLSYRPITLVFGNREYRFLSRIHIIRPQVTLKGYKSGNSIVSSTSTATVGSPTLYWPNAGDCGIDSTYVGRYTGGTYGAYGAVAADAVARSNGFVVEGLVLVGPGVGNGYAGNIDDHAINIHFGITMNDCAIRGWRGWGLYCNATASGASVNLGNNNGSLIRNTSFYYCGSGGIQIAGGDANQILVEECSVVECGVDMPAREDTFTTLIAGRQMHHVTITTAVNSTLYRLVVAGINCDYTSDASATLAEIRDGLVAAVIAAGIANVTAVATDADRLMVYGTNNSSFTCTETSANMTLVSTAPTTAPGSVFCLGGPATPQIALGDTVSCWMPTETWRGIFRGDVVDAGTGVGFLEIDLTLETVNHTVESIEFVTGTTWAVIFEGRAWTGMEHTNRTIDIFGSINLANDGSFPITRIMSGLYITTSGRFRISYAQPSARYWFVINNVEVSVTSAGSPTVTTIRDQLIAAINAAAIPGVTASIFDADEFTITSASAMVTVGPRCDNVGGVGRTVIEYTNAAGVAEPSSLGQWRIANDPAPQGGYTPGGGVRVRGRGAQIIDQPLIASTWKNCLINGPTNGDGYVAKGGYSKFIDCYTEGPLQSVIIPPAEMQGGSMYPVYNTKRMTVGNVHQISPAVRASVLKPGNGAVVGVLGDEVYPNSAFGWEYTHGQRGDIFRMMREQTAQGVGSWELMLNPGTSALALLRIAANNNTDIGPGAIATGQPGMYFNYAAGTLPNPRSAWSNGSSGVTLTNDDAAAVGTTGYVEWRRNGSYMCRYDVHRVFLISGVTNAAHASATIGTHNIAVGQQGRCSIRNVQGMTGVNGDRQWTRNASSSIFLEDTAGANLNSTLSGTHVAGTGIAILGRMIAHAEPTFSGGALSLADGNWFKGDRFVALQSNTRVQGQTEEWVCVTTGVGAAAVWRRVSRDGIAPSGSIYVSTPAATVIAAANTPVLVAGTTTLRAGQVLFDMPANGRLRHIGAETQRFRVTARLSIDPETAAEIAEAFLYVNGVAVVGTGQRVSMGAVGNVSHLSLEAEVNLALNDYVEVWIENETSGGDITASRLQLSAVAM